MPCRSALRLSLALGSLPVHLSHGRHYLVLGNCGTSPAFAAFAEEALELREPVVFSWEGDHGPAGKHARLAQAQQLATVAHEVG